MTRLTTRAATTHPAFNGFVSRGGMVASVLLASAILASTAEASLVRVNLGIYGGQANDLTSYVGSGGNTRLVVAVRGDIGAERMNNAGTSWEGAFYGRPGEMQEVEADITDSGVGSGAGVVYALTLDGQLLRNDSEVAGLWTRAGWSTVTNGGVFYNLLGVQEAVTTILGHSSGTYVGTKIGNIYRTTDGGVTWSLLATPVAAQQVLSVAAYVDNATNPVLYAVVNNAGSSELYKLTYAGSYSAAGPASVPGSGGIIERVFVYPSTTITEAPLLFVTGNSPSQAVYRGENDGGTWSTVTASHHYFQEMRFDAVNDRVYAVGGVSIDRGLTFSSMPNVVRAEGDIHPNDGTMVIDPNDADHAYYASDWFVTEYTEAASVWTAVGELVNANGAQAVLLNDIHQVADTATTKDSFIIGGKTGVGITQDFLTHAGPHPTWTYPIYPMDDGSEVTATRLQDYDADGTVMETVFVGNRGGKLYRSTSQGLTAASYLREFDVAVDAAGYFVDSNRVTISDIAESTTSLDDMWISFGDWDFGNNAGGIACSTDHGATWQVDPAWVTFGDSMSVNALIYTNTKFWAGVGKSDDSDPAHTGLYAKTGSLAGCGAGTWTREATGTDLDTSVVNDLDGPTTTPLYVAASTGLYRGTLSGAVWTFEELTGSLDPELAELPSAPADSYSAVAFNPAPAGYDEEFYAATGDQIYRLRLLGTTWTVDLISPTPHETVSVLLWDALVVGGSGSLSSLGAVTKGQDSCRSAARKLRSSYVKGVYKASAACRDAYLDGGPSCPDAGVAAAISKVEAKANLAAKCTDDVVTQLTEVWSQDCFGATTVAELQQCTLEAADSAVGDAIDAEYGDEAPARVGAAVACQRAIGKAYGKGMLAKGLKVLDKCDRDVDRARRVSCPDSAATDSLLALSTKAADLLSMQCSSGDVTMLASLGFGGSCAGATSLGDLQSCQSADHQAELSALFAQPTDAF